MPLRLSSHAIEQAARRGISEEIVLDVAANPEQVLRVSANREIRQSRIAFDERNEHLLVRVVVDRHPEEELIVTVYRTSRILKYWAHQ